jgi:hypothetical protein
MTAANPTRPYILSVSFRRLPFLLLFACYSLFADAQRSDQRRVEVSEGIHLTLPSLWGVTRQATDSAEIDYPVLSTGADNPKSGAVAAPSAQIMVFTERRAGDKEALARLVEIASETPGKAKVKTLAGWPSIFKAYQSLLPQSGDANLESTKPAYARFAAAVVAVDKRVIHFTVLLAPGGDAKLFTEAVGIVNHVEVDNKPDPATLRTYLRDLQTALDATSKKLSVDKKTQSLNSLRYAAASPERSALVTAEVMPLAGQQYSHVQDGEGELEVAVSSDGQNVVVVANSGVSFSHDGGQTFHQASIPERSDDPSVAVGKSGNFYYSWIGKSRNVDSVSVSTDLGEHFRFLGNAVVLPEKCATDQPCLPDQPHIASDRSAYSASGSDRLYLVWRDTSGNLKSPKISCSVDGGQTWPTVKTIYDTASDIFPRISVGSDGAVFVIFATAQAILLNKYSDCDGGLQMGDGFPVTVTSFINVSCPVPGLDRCNNGNILSSPTVSEDDLDPKHIYVAWASATMIGKNEDIMVADSMDGGRTFPHSTRLNAPLRARRFMPWMATYHGVAYVNWYDRRYANAPGASNDLTHYLGASASVAGGNLVAGKEVDLSRVDDPQCSNLWPQAPRSEQDALLCSVPAQAAGRCYGTNTPCDFNIPCPGGRQCSTGRGLPKYGDYNGVAAMSGKLFSFWTSIEPPSGVTVSSGDSNNSADPKRLHIFGLIEVLPR